jgi:hypothetical protein
MSNVSDETIVGEVIKVLGTSKAKPTLSYVVGMIGNAMGLGIMEALDLRVKMRELSKSNAMLFCRIKWEDFN